MGPIQKLDSNTCRPRTQNPLRCARVHQTCVRKSMVAIVTRLSTYTKYKDNSFHHTHSLIWMINIIIHASCWSFALAHTNGTKYHNERRWRQRHQRCEQTTIRASASDGGRVRWRCYPPSPVIVDLISRAHTSNARTHRHTHAAYVTHARQDIFLKCACAFTRTRVR